MVPVFIATDQNGPVETANQLDQRTMNGLLNGWKKCPCRTVDSQVARILESGMSITSVRRTSVGKGDFVLRVFGVYVIALLCASGISSLLIRVLGAPATVSDGLTLPQAFHASTVVLIIGSWQLHRATGFVSIEKQKPFRRSLKISLVLGILFVGIQSYGIWCLLHGYPQTQIAQSTQTGAHGFVFVFVSLHALHFTVAMMFLVYVTVNGTLDRYDHEYYWGVTFCEWFWHALGIVWLMILAVFAIAV